mgnify:FL=1|tara:strand:- start:428 stop:853 length:426 start_codon:yes stop_codon:yes gene_type:complete
MKSKSLRPFHLAFPVNDITESKVWYVKFLGCKVGRESKTWIDFNFFGHQISAHLSIEKQSSQKNDVDSKKIPIRHFGIILRESDWNNLKNRLINLNINFIVEPYRRFKNQKGEQSTFFIKDPSGNYLEFKSFKNDSTIFEN